MTPIGWRDGRVQWRKLNTCKVKMAPRIEGWTSLMEQAEEEEGGDDPKDGGVHPATPR